MIGLDYGGVDYVWMVSGVDDIDGFMSVKIVEFGKECVDYFC